MDRYRVIERFATQNNWTHGLELGVWVGVTTLWLMKNTTVNMTCVDAWEVQNDNPEYDWQYNKKPIFKNGKLLRCYISMFCSFGEQSTLRLSTCTPGQDIHQRLL